MPVLWDGGPSDRERPSDCPVHTLPLGPSDGFPGSLLSKKETELLVFKKKKKKKKNLMNCEIHQSNK